MTSPGADPHAGLSAREREIMDIVFRLRRTTAAEIRRQMRTPPTNATVRSTLRVLETKGWVEHSRDGARFVYSPVVSREQVKRKALSHLVRTFFDDSPAEAISALLGARGRPLTDSERARVEQMLHELKDE